MTRVRRILYQDKDGSIELPMKLFIIAILMAVTIPGVFAGLNEYQEYQMKLDIEMEMDKLVSKINSVNGAGNTSSDTVTVSFRNRFMASIEFINIGDNILPLNKDNTGDTNAELVWYQVKGESKQFIKLDCLATNKEFNGPLPLGEGDYKIRLTHLIINSESFVTLEVIY